MVSRSAWAVEPFKLKDIRVEGLQRVESGTVFASLPFRIGDLYNDESGAAAIRALFGLGLFKDVRLETQGDVLVVIVEERPSISQIEWLGLKEFDKDVLVKALKEVVSIRAGEVARGEKVGEEDLEDIQDPGAPREGQAHATLPQRVHSGFCAHAQNTL